MVLVAARVFGRVLVVSREKLVSEFVRGAAADAAADRLD